MGKNRYYCEYCDRSFIDDLQARRKHLSGTLHSRLRKEYYAPYRSAKEIYEEERTKDICRKFMTFNECPFGTNCRFTHYTPYQLDSLRLQAEGDLRSGKHVTPEMFREASSRMSSEDTVTNWLEVWKSKKSAEELNTSKPALEAVSQAFLSWDLPAGLKGCIDLPPSLQPWKLADIENVQIDHWG